MIARALMLEKLPQLLRIHVVGTLIDIDEFRARSCLRNRFRRGDEGIRHCNYRIALSDAGCDQGKTQRVGTAVHTDRKTRATKKCERLLEFFNHWATDEASAAQRLLENIRQLFEQRGVRGHQIKKRNAIRIGHFVDSAIDSIRRNILAGFPATIVFARTSFVTTLPAPTIAFSPTVMFDRIVVPEPIEAPFFTSVRSTFQ